MKAFDFIQWKQRGCAFVLLMILFSSAKSQTPSEIPVKKPATGTRTKHVLIAGAYAGTTYLTYRFFDTKIQQAVQANRSSAVSRVSAAIGHAGLGSSNLIITGITGVVGIAAKNDRLKKAAIILAGSHVINDFITEQFKTTFQRHRPNTGDAYNTFDWRGGPGINQSFFSAHTSNCFCTATVFAMCCPDKKWVAVAGYSVAALVGLSRIYDNAHWASDVLAGAACGYMSAKLTGQVYNAAAKRWKFLPAVNNGHYTANFIFRLDHKLYAYDHHGRP